MLFSFPLCARIVHCPFQALDHKSINVVRFALSCALLLWSFQSAWGPRTMNTTERGQLAANLGMAHKPGPLGIWWFSFFLEITLALKSAHSCSSSWNTLGKMSRWPHTSRFDSAPFTKNRASLQLRGWISSTQPLLVSVCAQRCLLGSGRTGD